MYNEKFVSTVKVNGKVLREQGDKVFVPWNSEYSIYLKNLNSQRALVNVEIDGECVTGSGLILDQNQCIDLERYLDGNLNKGRKFKFIKRTGDIENFRGARAEDGLVRVEYQFEEQVKYYPPYIPTDHYGWNIHDDLKEFGNKFGTYCGTAAPQNSYLRGTVSSNSLNVDPGITVKGSESSQSFRYGNIGTLENMKHAIVMQIVGIDYEKPITVKTKKQCPSCGRSFHFGATYCSHDGTYLELCPR